MAKTQKKAKSKKSRIRVRDLKTPKDPKGGLIGLLGPGAKIDSSSKIIAI